MAGLSRLWRLSELENSLELPVKWKPRSDLQQDEIYAVPALHERNTESKRLILNSIPIVTLI